MPYKEEEIEEILSRINKVHYKEKISNEEYMLLRPRESLKGKENLFNKYTNFNENSKFKDSNGNGFIKSISKMKGSSSLKNQSFSQSFVKLPLCTNNSSSKDSWGKGESGMKGCTKKIKFNNIIIIVRGLLCRKAGPSPRRRYST